MFGQVKSLEKSKTFIDPEIYPTVKSILDSQIEVLEYSDPKYKRHRCKLLKKVKLPPSEVDYMVNIFIFFG